jgi:hypothetical protein
MEQTIVTSEDSMKSFLFAFFILGSTSFAQAAETCNLHVANLGSAVNQDRTTKLDLQKRALRKGYILHFDDKSAAEGDYVISSLFTPKESYKDEPLIMRMHYIHNGPELKATVNTDAVIAKVGSFGQTDVESLKIQLSEVGNIHTSYNLVTLASIRAAELLVKKLPSCRKLNRVSDRFVTQINDASRNSVKDVTTRGTASHFSKSVSHQ